MEFSPVWWELRAVFIVSLHAIAGQHSAAYVTARWSRLGETRGWSAWRELKLIYRPVRCTCAIVDVTVCYCCCKENEKMLMDGGVGGLFRDWMTGHERESETADRSTWLVCLYDVASLAHWISQGCTTWEHVALRVRTLLPEPYWFKFCGWRSDFTVGPIIASKPYGSFIGP